MSAKSGRDEEKNDGLRQLIHDGTAMLGSGAGAAVGAVLGLLGGPGGAAIGGITGKLIENLISKVGQEISERHLSTREKVRVGAVLVIAAEEIRKRLESGENLRDDSFFDEKQMGRSDAEEVAESVLLKAQREPEEKKIQYMGYLYSSIVFDPEISVHVAHQLTKVAAELTYRQLCILRFCEVKRNFGLLHESYRSQQNFTRELSAVVSECYDLYRRGLIHFGRRDALSFYDVSPISMTIHELGLDLFNFMKLCLIPDEDIVPIAEQLKSSKLEINNF